MQHFTNILQDLDWFEESPSKVIWFNSTLLNLFDQVWTKERRSSKSYITLTLCRWGSLCVKWKWEIKFSREKVLGLMNNCEISSCDIRWQQKTSSSNCAADDESKPLRADWKLDSIQEQFILSWSENVASAVVIKRRMLWLRNVQCMLQRGHRTSTYDIRVS